MNSTRLFSAEQENPESGYVPFFEAPAAPWPPHLKPADTRALRRSYRLEARAKPLRQVEAESVLGPEKPEGVPFAALEGATKTFRYHRMRDYQRGAAAATRELLRLKDAVFRLREVVALKRARDDGDSPDWQRVYPARDYDGAAAAEGHTKVFRELEARIRWYQGRAGAQLPRFDTVRQCGTRTMHVSCKMCNESLCEPLPCSCGVARVCESCSKASAEKRQKRIARARVALLLNADATGLFIRKRRGGRAGEKMLTLTVPHISLDDARGDLRAECTGLGLATTVNVRIAALRLAWPKFMRRVRRWLRVNDPAAFRSLAYYRLFEWTRGHDGKGHPHFHVYLFSPFIDDDLLQEWWGVALESVGCPLPTGGGWRCCGDQDEGPHRPCHRKHVIVDIKRLAGFNIHALRELVKSGDQRAIDTRMGKLCAPGLDAIDYAKAWTMSEAFKDLTDESRASALDVEADLYCAGEGRRMAQGARGFLAPPARPICVCCGASMFAAAIALPWETCEEKSRAADEPREERGPPS